MRSSFLLFPTDGKDGVPAEADYEADTLSIEMDGGTRKFSLSDALHSLDKAYHIIEPPSGWKREFTDAEKAKLRPIAETLAMLDGNAFFGMTHGDREHYEGYLSEAHAVYEANGGDGGWAGASSIGKDG